MCTVQAPHRPVPQPNLVPVSLRSSRSTHNSGVASGALVDAGLPFTTKLVAIVSSLEAGAGRSDRLHARSAIIATLGMTGKRPAGRPGLSPTCRLDQASNLALTFAP